MKLKAIADRLLTKPAIQLQVRVHVTSKMHKKYTYPGRNIIDNVAVNPNSQSGFNYCENWQYIDTKYNIPKDGLFYVNHISLQDMQKNQRYEVSPKDLQSTYTAGGNFQVTISPDSTNSGEVIVDIQGYDENGAEISNSSFEGYWK